MSSQNSMCGKSVRIGDREIHVYGDKEYVESEFEKLRSAIFGDTEVTHASLKGRESSASTSEKRQSLREFVDCAGKMSKANHLALVGYFFEKYLGEEKYTIDELKSKAAESKVLLGKNVSRDISKLQKAGKIEKYGKKEGRDAFRLTIRGEKFVEEGLQEMLP